MALNFIGMAILWLGSSFLMKLLTPKVKGPSSGPADADVDVSGDEGDPVAVVFGTCRVQPKVTWWGDLKRVPVKEVAQPGGLLNAEHKVTVATEHHVGMMMVVCMGPIDQLDDIVVDEDLSINNQAPTREKTAEVNFGITTVVTWVYGAPINPIVPAIPVLNPGGVDPTTLTITAPTVLGGKGNGGGISGILKFFWGNDPQEPDGYLATKIAADTEAIALTGVIDTMPRWNRICYAVAYQMNMGESPQIRPLQFIVRRYPKILAGTAEGIALGLDALPYYATVYGEANPAEVILEVLTDPFFGVGVTANYDLAMFAEAAYYLYLEQVGVSATLQRKGSAKEFLDEVLRHIDGILTQDPLTGLIGLKLQRLYTNPVTQGFLTPEMTVTEENCTIKEVKYPGYRSNVNEVKVTFTNASRMFKSDVAQAQELALMEMANGDVVSETYDFPFFTNHELAQTKAFQLLRELRGPHQIRFTADRSFARISAGSLIVVDLPERRLFNMRFRVAKVDAGTIVDGEIEIEAIEDVFAAIGSPYSVPVGGGGQPTNPNPGWQEPQVTPHQAQNFPNGTVIPGNGVDPGGAYGVVELGINDPYDAITAIRFWKQEGTAARTGPVAFNMANIDTEAPSEFVELDALFDSYIWWEVDYTDQDGSTVTLSQMHTFSKRTTPGETLADPDFLVGTASAVLPNERVVTDTPTVEWNVSVAGVAEAHLTELARRRGLVFVFTAADVGQLKAIVLPWDCTAMITRARLEDVAGTATFKVFFATSVTAALSSVGGTDPSVFGPARGANDTSLDWTTVDFLEGEVIAVELDALGTAYGATLVIEVLI